MENVQNDSIEKMAQKSGAVRYTDSKTGEIIYCVPGQLGYADAVLIASHFWDCKRKRWIHVLDDWLYG